MYILTRGSSLIQRSAFSVIGVLGRKNCQFIILPLVPKHSTLFFVSLFLETFGFNEEDDDVGDQQSALLSYY